MCIENLTELLNEGTEIDNDCRFIINYIWRDIDVVNIFCSNCKELLEELKKIVKDKNWVVLTFIDMQEKQVHEIYRDNLIAYFNKL